SRRPGRLRGEARAPARRSQARASDGRRRARRSGRAVRARQGGAALRDALPAAPRGQRTSEPMRRVHLDHNATTTLRPEVREPFLARLDALGGNPSSVHLAGRTAKAWLDEARERTAAALSVHEDEIVF